MAALLLVLAAGCDAEPPQPKTAPGGQPPAPESSRARAPGEAPPAAATPTREPRPKSQAKPADAGADAEDLSPMPATVTRATELKAKPFVDAQTIASLEAGSEVTVLARDGGWYRVARAEREGWVRLLHVSTQSAARGIGTEELESAARIATGRQGAGNIASTTGVRGLTPEQLREAQPDTEELERLEQYAAAAKEALAYARAHDLERRDVPHLPDPQ